MLSFYEHLLTMEWQPMSTVKLPHRAAVWVGSAASCLLAASQAVAHAKLEAATPAADSTVDAPKIIQVHFSEAVEASLSRLRLAAGGDIAIAVVPMNDTEDPTTLSIRPIAGLKPGIYTVTWSVVADDGHRTRGTYSFTVR
jgi:methionine-rich copper-binding protein CopC